MKRVGKRLISSFLVFALFIGNATIIHAEESQYAHSDEASSGGVTLKVEWNDPVLGQETTFHVSATGGSGNYKFRMEAPSYTDPDVLSYESVADPSRGEWLNYTEECSSHDYTFTMMASGTYNFRFYVMDKAANMNYLRTNTFIQVSSPNYPSVNSIVQSAVAQCNAETDGSDYAKALWLHDWLLNRLDYDKSLKWSSAESALTRGLGTCQSYESAYSKLLTAAGIENAETRDTYDGHTWNAFKIDGEWYQVDCTWDDSNDDWYNFDERRLYFGLTDELMSIAHPGHAKIYTAAGYATRSTSLANNYFVKSGEAAQWVASYKDRIQENLNAGKTQFSITADNATYPPSIYGIQNGIIAYVINTTDWYVNGKKVDLVAKTNGAQFDFTVPCTEHEWDEGKVTTEPTCEKEGIKTYTCKNCQTIQTESIKALDHDYSKEWTIDQKATCQQEGSKSYHCTRCDSKKDVTSISKKEHEWDNGIVTKEATNKETGIKTYKCKNCNETKTEIIPIKKDESNVDSEAPVIDVSSIKLSTTSATKGDTVTISVKITDNVGITSSMVYLINQETKKDILLRTPVYNENDDTYEFSMKIGDDVPNGHWYIKSINAYDEAKNKRIETFEKDDHFFIVSSTRADSKAPVIDISSIKLSTKSAKVGDTLTVFVKITDNVGIKSSSVHFKNYETEKDIFLNEPIYNEQSGLYEYSLKINNDVQNGQWYIKSINAYDEVENKSIETFEQNEYVFLVSGSKADSEVPKIDVNSVKFSSDLTTAGDIVKIFVKITDNVGIKSSSVHFKNYETEKDIFLNEPTYNEQSGLYEYSLKINDDVPNGHWYIKSINAYDEAGNKSIETFLFKDKYWLTVSRNNIDVHQWDEGEIISKPTCTKDGSIIYTCSICKDTKTEAIKALGHDYSSSWTIDKAATCTNEGSKSHHCTRCDSKADVTVIPKTSHNWDSGVVTTKATCTKEGVKTYTCKDCKTTKTEVINALGHDSSSSWTIDKAATCTNEGSKSHHCTRCDSKKDVTVIPKTSHNWDAGVITTKATCTKDGVKTYTCKDCKITKTEVIKALGHDYSSSWTIDKAATCTNEGSKSHHCSRCDSKKDVTVIPKTGHSWDKGTIVKNPTYSETGIKCFTCTKCGNTKDEVIAVLVDKDASILYKTHVQDIGWQDFVQDGKMSGTSGRSKRLEGIQIKLSSRFKGNVEYQTHVQDIGWQGWKSNGTMSGTSGKSKRLEAIRIKLTGEIANKYDVYYRVHCQDFGWLGWAKNGESSGSEGCSKRLEAIEIRLVRKGEKAPGSTNNTFVRKNNTVESASISYRTHVQDYGWQNYVSDGKQSGTSGKSKRLEGINIKLSSTVKGSVLYRTHVQDYGWQSWKQNNEMSGTQGKSKRLEAIQIKLTGDIANKYDVYYRVHCQDFGWLGWAKNGESSGSEGYSKRLEAIEIRLVPKGQRAPGNTNNKYYKK